MVFSLSFPPPSSSGSGWKQTLVDQLLAQPDPFGFVHSQDPDRCSPDRRFPDE
jgi:hypothetical protein